MLTVSIICDDQQTFNFLFASIASLDQNLLVSRGINASQLAHNTNSLKPEVILFKSSRPNELIFKEIEFLRTKLPSSEIILLLSPNQIPYILSYLSAGVIGFLTYPLSQNKISDALNIIKSGGSPLDPKLLHSFFDKKFSATQSTVIENLTKREQQVMMLISEGLSYKLVASQLDMSLETVRHHIKHIYKKLHINSKGELINRVFTSGNKL